MVRWILLFAVWFAAATAAAGALPAGTAAPRLLVLGDSLSAAYGIDPASGWVALLGRRLRQAGFPHRVVNASISGDTSTSGRRRLAAALARFRPDIVCIELGANDGLRGLSPALLRANLDAMVREVRAHGAAPVLIGVRLPPNYGAAFTDSFSAVYREVALTQNVPLAPRLLARVGERPELMQADGLHPTAAAQPRLLANVWPVLEPVLRQRGRRVAGGRQEGVRRP